MDPYIERPEIWPDFHNSLVIYIKAALQPVLRPKYVALGQDRHYVVESERPIWPDVAVIRTNASDTRMSSAAAVCDDVDAPAVFLVAVTRRQPSRQEVYAISLKQRLPKVWIPLGSGDSDVPLELQAVFSQCWEAGPYPELLNYDGPPPGTLTAEESAWCQQIARKAFQTAEGSIGPGAST
jgi:hypothetical protein